MMRSWARSMGFTLIELMIIVVIVAILATIALASYDAVVLKTRRSDGQSMLLQVLQQQERYFTENLSYTDDLSELGYTPENDQIATESGHYTIGAAACEHNLVDCVALTATAVGRQSKDGNLGINSLGVKTPVEKW